MLGQLLTQSVIGTRELTEVISGGARASASARDVHSTDRSASGMLFQWSVGAAVLADVWVGVL